MLLVSWSATLNGRSRPRIRVVERLDRAALEKKSKITRALAAGVVTALDEGQAAFDL